MANPSATTCIDCRSPRVRPLYVREPKDSNFAVPAPPDVEPDDSRYVLLRCQDCASVFLHPYYYEEAAGVYSDPRYFTGYYPDNIHTGGGPRAGAPTFSRYDERRMRRRARQLLRLAGLGRRRRPVAVMDIGCAQGFLLRGFADCGCEVHGVEISDQALGAREAGLDVYHGRFEDAPFSAEAFDLIVATQVFEHMTDLGPVCAAMRRTLRPDGVVLLSVPNDLEGYRSLLWRKRPWWLVPPMHVRYFAVASARRIFARHGLRLAGAVTRGHVGGDAGKLLAWYLGRTAFAGLTRGKLYEAFRFFLGDLLRPLDLALIAGGRHMELILKLRRA